MEQAFDAASRKEEIPGVILLAADRSGRFRYANCFGPRSVNDPQIPMTLQTPIWMASWTKLMTAIATLQCLEKGMISLDQDVTSILPELVDLPILQGFDAHSGEPILKKRTVPITIIQLLTHTAGMAYDVFSPLLRRWRAYKGEELASGSTGLEKFTYPLVYEPGTSWEYSGAYNWLGFLIERLHGNMLLGTYMNTHIWEPLSIKNITFRPHNHPTVHQNMAALSSRDSSGSGKVVFAPNPFAKVPATEDGGGGGAYGVTTDFMRILESLMTNDGKLLRPETVDLMFKPQLEGFNKNRTDPQAPKIVMPNVYNKLGGFAEGTAKDWSIAGLVNCDDQNGGKRKGSVTCVGMANANWWMDRETGLYGLYATGVFPTRDAKTASLRLMFEKEMYTRFCPPGQAKL